MAPLSHFLVSLLAAGAFALPQDASVAGRPGPGGPPSPPPPPPPPPPAPPCKPKDIRVRKAWHTLSNTEKKAYIDAELCLMSKPTRLHLRGARTIFDDFQSAHVSLTEIVHYAGQFLPYHRLFVWAHEEALRRECGYRGAQPYWNETQDAGSFSTSVVLDPTTGFGGNGVGASRCIVDGPFANYTNSLGPGYLINDHCIDRSVTDFVSWAAHKQYADRCLAKSDWLSFWTCVEAAPHTSGHAGIGSQMTNPISSPGDPIFYLHHAYLDMLWAKWQALNPSVRLTEMGGKNLGNLAVEFPGELFPTDIPPPPGFNPGAGGGGPPVVDVTRPADVPQPLISGDPGNTTTLNHKLQMLGLTQDRTVGQVMNTKGGYLCYEYDQ
ncbi:hypothetical protein QBC47DRAFT_85536 [Echria macrotheca]|uniref:Tyrosinase copper-binding domain-containing protein n=1 Tax=Echria macrotheca TaxID=438768 RepID=A0AAJ0B865_9PEZI|nr:hypothetical protein QBC47DRAFT_85536 [Echria macrotheca]